jgi:hypothetical protein
MCQAELQQMETPAVEGKILKIVQEIPGAHFK